MVVASYKSANVVVWWTKRPTVGRLEWSFCQAMRCSEPAGS